ncbi:MAG TPA: RNA methyltransferase [Rhabdaerophilum sp.]|nr:RNA methyltransferase [Rhabdaerophilum sp.]
MTGVEVAVETVGSKGDGLVRLTDGTRLAIPFGLPGEIYRMEQTTSPATFERLTSSTDRVSPICRHFGICGGCLMQHWSPDAARGWKRERVAAALIRAGVEAEVTPPLDAHGAGRRRVTLHIRQREGGISAGFMRAGSHDLIDLDRCPLLVPELDPAPDLARGIGHILRGINKPMDFQVTASIEGLDCDLRGCGPLPESLRKKLIEFAVSRNLARLTLHGERLVEARTPHVTFEDRPEMRAFLPAGSFLQPTARGEAQLARLAREALGKTKHVVELFCGLGPFGLRLSREMKVTAYDSDAGAIETFNRSLRALPGGKPTMAEARDLFRRPLFAPELKLYDAALLDPPRQGAEAQIRELAKSKIPLIVYISCDPETFARDAKTLVGAGFQLQQVTPVDQFRHSGHVELTASFRR